MLTFHVLLQQLLAGFRRSNPVLQKIFTTVVLATSDDLMAHQPHEGHGVVPSRSANTILIMSMYLYSSNYMLVFLHDLKLPIIGKEEKNASKAIAENRFHLNNHLHTAVFLPGVVKEQVQT